MPKKKISKFLRQGFRYITYGVIIYLGYLSILYLFSEKSRGFGEELGYVAAYAFILVLLPGTIKRLKLHRLRVIKDLHQILMYSRTQLGIIMYLVMYVHHLSSGNEVWGVVILYLLLPLFLTSNQYSRRLLKKWWQRLHWLVYVALWVIVVHLVVVGGGFLIPLYLIFGLIEIYSLVITFAKK